MRRLAENTKLQSQVKIIESCHLPSNLLKIRFFVFFSQVQYHADFEKAKGKFTQVADDPETLRIKANSKIIR